MLYGPLVLAADATLADGKRVNALKLGLGNWRNSLDCPSRAEAIQNVARRSSVLCRRGRARNYAPIKIGLVPFADAGSTGAFYKVWLPLLTAARPPEADNALEDGTESRPRPGNVDGAILDGHFVVTFDGKPANEDWYAVTVDQPVLIRSVVFLHGMTFHDGGWFDASAGKPKVQVQATQGGPWQTVGELADYPATTATDPAGLKEGGAFHCNLVKSLQVVAVRVIGKPACGDNSQQAFSSCVGLTALPASPPANKTHGAAGSQSCSGT